ncbi:DUF1972 domain-containing protein [Paenibacillus sp. CC-CFT747]|nr:DUF1972 domain-containing protein [Paenibacillus sp. CC-CFT747]
MNHVFIIGSKGIPAKYGGFETFVDQLTRQKLTDHIQYHVSCQSDNDDEFVHNGTRCFNVKVPEIGPAKAVLYDVLSLKRCLSYIKENRIENAIVYILACRIGPFLSSYRKALAALGAKVYVNPDGHEWKRSKWNRMIRAYWKYSEKLMVKHADLLVCDSVGIEEYIQTEYKPFRPTTTYISYGADLERSALSNSSPKLREWYGKHELLPDAYYLIVGRFVPENNYELMIREFMASKTDKDLVLICNVEQNKFYERLLRSTNFPKDKRIKFVGTVYDQELLKKIRENAYGYLHGHEVGGTNPSLLEALAGTKLNLLLDVVFNKEVGRGGAVYFTKAAGSLARTLEHADALTEAQRDAYGKKAVRRIAEAYSWSKIVDQYEHLFLEAGLSRKEDVFLKKVVSFSKQG